MPKAHGSLSATNLANHHHFHCDLYLHYIYHGTDANIPGASNKPSELAKAQFERGLDWEASLYGWLDAQDMLMTVESGLLDASALQELIEIDERSHFFITGLQFWPPNEAFAKRYAEHEQEPVKFGMAKPDLLEVRKQNDRSTTWRVVDAKSSKEVKTSHHVQTFFYHLCLQHLLPLPRYRPETTLGIWLRGPSLRPSFADLKTVDTTLLADALLTFFFSHLPRILSTPRKQVKWHLNPLCRGCPFENIDNERAVGEKTIGAMPNIPLTDAAVLEQLLAISRGQGPTVSDIEELHGLFVDESRVAQLEHGFPSTVKRARRILGIPPRRKGVTVQNSPAVEAARTHEPQVVPRRNYTLPRSENVALTLSLVLDPTSGTIVRFGLTIASNVQGFAPSSRTGSGEELIPVLAETIHDLLRLRRAKEAGPTSQCYVFSTQERTALQRHLISAALTSAEGIDSEAYDDTRLCIGALCDGAGLLATSVQPLVLSGALLAFLGTKGARSKAELCACARRLKISDHGTVEQLRGRIVAEVERLKTEGGRVVGEQDALLGELPRVVVVKKEIERLLALPIAGYWDLPEAVIVMLEEDPHVLSDEEIFDLYKTGSEEELVRALRERNDGSYALLTNLRKRVNGRSLLVNDARELNINFMDLCEDGSLRKLFFMQQFEVLARLTELWNTRIDGCPDAPILQYIGPGKTTGIYEFKLLSGAIDASTDKTRSFFSYLLVEDSADHTSLPPEALFDDLPLAGQMFPLNRWTKPRWDAQHPVVRRSVIIADVNDLIAKGGYTVVTLRTYGGGRNQLRSGEEYRLSPRLVDFNLAKVLAVLLELDLRTSSQGEVPFINLITNPREFSRAPESWGNHAAAAVKSETAMRGTFRQLADLGSVPASQLMLKDSQWRAARRIMLQRLAVVWGPPGTGKTHTLAATLLQFLRFYIGRGQKQIVFLTAMTHAAIRACLEKLSKLVKCYREIPGLDVGWLDKVKIEHVEKGGDHPLPPKDGTNSFIYAGTVYQLHNFSKRRIIEVDCVVIDEAGQLSLGLAALALRSLGPAGRVVVAGDSEQLAPIFAAQYPEIPVKLFGSILDCVMARSQPNSEEDGAMPEATVEDSQTTASQDTTVVQLTENFRLNQDLGDFVATIYSRTFHAQKVQTRHIAKGLLDLEGLGPSTEEPASWSTRDYLLAVGRAMLGQRQSTLTPPANRSLSTNANDASTLVPRPISLALIRLSASTHRSEQIGYEVHVRGEAAVAAALVRWIRMACPDETIFVATPHRIQRHAVREALRMSDGATAGALVEDENNLADALTTAMEGLAADDQQEEQKMVIVDTVERLQGSEASFVICLFSHTSGNPSPTELIFLLERRRLNVAISRAKTICILITSQEVLRPPAAVLANRESAKGYVFLRTFEERAWSGGVDVDLDCIRT